MHDTFAPKKSKLADLFNVLLLLEKILAFLLRVDISSTNPALKLEISCLFIGSVPLNFQSE